MPENRTWKSRLTSKSAELVTAGSERAGRLSTLMSGARGRLRTQLSEKSQRTREAATGLRDRAWTALTSRQAPVQTLPDLADITDQQRVAYYGALVAMAATDGSIDREELLLLLDTFEADTLDETALAEVKGFLVKPPSLVACLEVLAESEETLRFGLTFQLVEMAYADDVVLDEERSALHQASDILSVNEEQLAAIENFVLEARRLEARGKNDKVATECLKQAAGSLASVGVPITAVYFSGSVVGLSAAGITSGLAALGLGFGMVPGIAVAVVLGTGTYLGLGRLLDTGGRRRREQEQAESERRAQLVIKHLQDTLQDLLARVDELHAAAEAAEENRVAIAVMKKRMQTLQSVIARKQLALESPC